MDLKNVDVAKASRRRADPGAWLRSEHSLELRAFLLCLGLAVFFYFPTLLAGSKNAGYLYTGDVLGFYAPTIMKVHAMVHAGNFTGLDYSLYNGSSDFFLSPNFFTFHPLIILYSLLTSPKSDTIFRIGQLLNVIMMTHAVLALYFSHRLFRRVLGLEFAAALFGAVMFTFGVHMVDSLGQPPFYLAATLFPWCICAVIEAIERPNLTRAVLGSVPFVVTLLSGYVPLSIASVEFSAATILGYLIYTHVVRGLTPMRTLRRALLAAIPPIIGAMVCALYLLSILLFGRETNAGATIDHYYSAYQMAETPVGLLRAISVYLIVPGPMAEFSVVVGLAPLTILAAFIFSPRSMLSLKSNEGAALLAAAAAYCFSVLAIFGQFSVASDVLYQFAPAIGKMHIYQRFLVFADLALATMISLMLVALARLRPTLTPRILFGCLIGLTCATAVLLVVSSTPGKIVAQPALVIELFCAALVAIVLMVPNRTAIYLTAAAVVIMPGLERMYQRSLDNTYATQAERLPLELKEAERASVVDYIKQRANKPFVKYADLTPMWHVSPDTGLVESFQKVFPYTVQNQLNLSSYTGFTFYLSERMQYRSRMPIGEAARMSPDWNVLLNTGADFLVVDPSLIANTVVPDKAEISDALHLPNGMLMVPVKQRYPGDPPYFDNGMVRLIKPLRELAVGPDLALGAQATESAVSAPASLAVDGRTNGDFTLGSVAHTGRDQNAWLDVDLGKSQPLGLVRIWNRTDCCTDRIANAWLFVSEQPFAPSDDAASLQKRPGVFAYRLTGGQQIDVNATGVSGRYVRVQLPGDEPKDAAFLHIAELQVFPPLPGAPSVLSAAPQAPTVTEFKANFANHMKVKVDLKSPALFVYEFADNPRLTYKVDGKRVKFDDSSGAPSYLLPAGSHVVEIKYHFGPLVGFWIVYGLYWLGILALLAVLLAQATGLLRKTFLERIEAWIVGLTPRALREA